MKAPLLDPSVLSALKDLAGPEEAQEFLDELIDVFSNDVSKDLIKLEDALRCDDGEQIMHLAHRLKGYSANLGARTMYELCKSLEDLSRKGGLRLAPPLLEDLKRNFALVSEKLSSKWHG